VTHWPEHRKRLEAAAHGNRGAHRDAIRAALARIDDLENVIAVARIGARIIEKQLAEAQAK
jgi:hypothetical protein